MDSVLNDKLEYMIGNSLFQAHNILALLLGFDRYKIQ